MRKALVVIAGLLTFTTGLAQLITASAAGAAQSAQGVTPSTIAVGITYPNVAAIRNLINVDPGITRWPTRR